MTIDVPMAVGGLLVGTIVGLTGMGGGALMTPMLVFFFNVNPLTAISSDLVVSLLMKPVGAAVHMRRGTVNVALVAWLCVGSVPAAFSGAWLISMVPEGFDIESILKLLLGFALIMAATGLVIRSLYQMYRNRLPLGEGPARSVRPELVIRPVPTILLGALAGFMVGMTSVGAGSIIIVVLLLMYPALKASQLVGTDLAQAIPLVGAAALGHILFGSFSMEIAASLLVGAIPGAWIGAQVSSRAPGGIIRRALAVLLLASGLKLMGAPSEVVLAVAAGALVFGSLFWVWVKRRAAPETAPRPVLAPAVQPIPEPVPADMEESW
jgi:uncharacterized membrane protein YfcA